jgi:hypothetical protein
VGGPAGAGGAVSINPCKDIYSLQGSTNIAV